MKITALSIQQKDQNRVNVMVDGKYRFSLDVYQLAHLGVRVDNEYSDKELAELETESQFGKLYSRALEYCLMRPHSAREVRDYLYRKTRTTMVKSRRTGEMKERLGVSMEMTVRVFDRLVEKGYIDDEKFTRFWVENRNQTKGVSRRKLQSELMAKGVNRSIIEQALLNSNRTDNTELMKVIAKKRSRYPDEQKLMQYLARQGFSYDDIKHALDSSSEYDD
jgi:regulatory protein